MDPDKPECAAGLCVRPAAADLWDEPSPEAEVEEHRVSQLLMGAPVRVLEASNGYDYAEGPDGYRGWIRHEHLAPLPADAGDPRLVGELRAPLYPSPDAPQFSGEIFYGTRVPAGEELAGRLRVLLPGGPAWVPAECLRPVPAAGRPIDAAELLADARRFLGVPYRWGGGSPFGVDCSGFVQVLFRLQGHELRRDADLQTAHGRPVETDELRAGDLLFIGRSDDKGMPTHVGIMLDAGSFIHAHGSPANRVEISPLDEFTDRLWGARRIE